MTCWSAPWPDGASVERLSMSAGHVPVSSQVSSLNLTLNNKAKGATNLHDGEVVIIWPLAFGCW